MGGADEARSVMCTDASGSLHLDGVLSGAAQHGGEAQLELGKGKAESLLDEHRSEGDGCESGCNKHTPVHAPARHCSGLLSCSPHGTHEHLLLAFLCLFFPCSAF